MSGCVPVMMPVPKLIPPFPLAAFVPSNMRAVIVVHPSKALFPTLCISACRNISVIEVQFLKALFPILFMLLEILARVAGAASAGIGSFWMTVVSAVQPSKALSPMASAGSGSMTFSSFAQSAKPVTSAMPLMPDRSMAVIFSALFSFKKVARAVMSSVFTAPVTASSVCSGVGVILFKVLSKLPSVAGGRLMVLPSANVGSKV